MMKERLNPGEAGFTLIELMVSMVMALIIMAGLFISFSTQNTEYSYQNRRIDSAQDLEFTLKFAGEDLRSALTSLSGAPTGDPVENAAFAGTGATTSLTFWVWDEIDGLVAMSNRAQRAYALVGNSLRYDREASVVDNTGNANNEILDSVTFFKVFRDAFDLASLTSRAAFADIPPPMVPLTVNDPSGNQVNVPGYTILIEVAVPAGYTQGRMTDVLGNDLTGTADQRKRIWRYAQIYPMTVVN